MHYYQEVHTSLVLVNLLNPGISALWKLSARCLLSGSYLLAACSLGALCSMLAQSLPIESYLLHAGADASKAFKLSDIAEI